MIGRRVTVHGGRRAVVVDMTATGPVVRYDDGERETVRPNAVEEAPFEVDDVVRIDSPSVVTRGSLGVVIGADAEKAGVAVPGYQMLLNYAHFNLSLADPEDATAEVLAVGPEGEDLGSLDHVEMDKRGVWFHVDRGVESLIAQAFPTYMVSRLRLANEPVLQTGDLALLRYEVESLSAGMPVRVIGFSWDHGTEMAEVHSSRLVSAKVRREWLKPYAEPERKAPAEVRREWLAPFVAPKWKAGDKARLTKGIAGTASDGTSAILKAGTAVTVGAIYPTGPRRWKVYDGNGAYGTAFVGDLRDDKDVERRWTLRTLDGRPDVTYDPSKVDPRVHQELLTLDLIRPYNVQDRVRNLVRRHGEPLSWDIVVTKCDDETLERIADALDG